MVCVYSSAISLGSSNCECVVPEEPETMEEVVEEMEALRLRRCEPWLSWW